jgi:hypothetical protein
VDSTTQTRAALPAWVREAADRANKATKGPWAVKRSLVFGDAWDVVQNLAEDQEYKLIDMAAEMAAALKAARMESPCAEGQLKNRGKRVDSMTEHILAWHFLPDDRKLRYAPYTPVEPGQVLRVEGPLELCRRGLHASIRPLDALRYAPGSIVCRVEMGGDILHGDDKLCASERKTLWVADATNALHEFACLCAERELLRRRRAGREPDKRSWAAIEAKRAWLRGEIDDKALAAAARDAVDAANAAWAAAVDAADAAAWAAARDAVDAAAWAALAAAVAAADAAAWAAARAAADAAAWDAAWAAARAAADAAAWDAAWAAARAEQNAELERALGELAPKGN